MNDRHDARPDVQKVLGGLKDFQKATVEYVFQRLYLDQDAISRFLIADEVGLGKTLVARGVIAKAVDRLWNDVTRIDVVYICSNQDIAQQNIDRLNITQDRTFQHASRATLLPIKIQQLRQNKLNFVSLTPGTSFNMSSRVGWAWERVVLYYLLRKAWRVSAAGLSNILRGDVGSVRWKGHLVWFQQNEKIDQELEAAFISELRKHTELRSQYDALVAEIDPRRKNLNETMRRNRNSFIINLRRLLAKSSLTALEPDLIILDEFQRFKYLLDEDNEFALLAQELFNFQDVGGRHAKVLLLSATPYKMYTVQGEEGENHYEDFLRTIRFLLNGQGGEPHTLETAIGQYRRSFMNWNYDEFSHQKLYRAKAEIETILRKVMVRTERLAVSKNRNGMLTETCIAHDQIRPGDLTAFVHLDRIANHLGAEDQTEYWKSSAYPLNLMEGYKLKRKFEEAYKRTSDSGLYALLEKAHLHLLNWQDIQKYLEIDPGNARLRALLNLTIESDNWRLLWLPPNLPYYLPEGPFANVPERGWTKSLIFSAWKIVPKVIAVSLSYEAERRILSQEQPDFNYEELTDKRKPLLRFAISKERKSGMSVFSLIYPCITLAKEIDPLAIAKRSGSSHLSSSFYMLEKTKLVIRRLLTRIIETIQIDDSGPIDESWYWIAPLLLDRHFHSKTLESWFKTNDPSLAWKNMLKPGSDEDDDSGFADHIREFSGFLDPNIRMGRQPSDLLDVLARIAIASPAVVVLRSLLRVTGTGRVSPSILAAAAQAGLGFRTLFNQPDTIILLQSLSKDIPDEEKIYWRSILAYSLQGNLQATLDEYLHVLAESLGLAGHDPDESANKIGSTLRQALSLRPPSLRFDEINLDKTDQTIKIVPHSIRCRYALRFGDEKGETYETGSRDTDVRVAFNSPFRPFVLATTSIGQEGLDFHQYCHRVVHWNLPTNPVDLEQREGRVHRYKCHVIRRNLAEHYNIGSISISANKLTDPWKLLFQNACQERRSGDNDLVPYWIYEGGRFTIERLVPILPLSRELSRLEQLKTALVTYRSVIGQPRQQELLEFLSNQLSDKDRDLLLDKFTIDLSPPTNHHYSNQQDQVVLDSMDVDNE